MINIYVAETTGINQCGNCAFVENSMTRFATL